MKTAAALLAVAALAGCYRTRFDLSPPAPEMTSLTYDNHFHLNVINIIEVSRPVDLQRACAGAPPTAIEEEVSVVGAVVNAVLGYVIPILTVHNATVMCPAGALMGPMMGPQPMGPQPMGPQPMGPQPMGPQPMGPPPGQPAPMPQ